MLLQVNQLTKKFGGLTAVQDLDFVIKEGELLSLVGPNGSGKTTVFNLLTGVHKPDDGEIIFKGDNIAGCKPYEIAARGIGRTFQLTKLFNQVSTMQNVLTGLHCRTKTSFWGAISRYKGARLEEESSLEKAKELIDLMGLSHVAGQPAENLSSAEQRRLMIAIAMASDPTLLLLDEPIAGMGAAEINELLGMLRKIRERGISVLLIEHNMRVVMGVSDRIAVLNYGVKIAEGLPEEIARNEAVIEAYLGRDADAPHS
jgi:branched-chain amino acid transport system ATP-binding protein